jgi:YD repeat-containing protein
MIKEPKIGKKQVLFGSCFLGMLLALAFIPVDQSMAAGAGDLSGFRFSIGVKAPVRTNLPPVSTTPTDRPKSPSPSPIQPRFIPVELSQSFRPKPVPLIKSPNGTTIPVLSKSMGMTMEMMSTSGSTRYWYDPLNRLIRVAYPDRAFIRYSYDKTGNRMSRNIFIVDVSCDFNNDRKADIGIYRVSEGVWYITPSGGGTPYGVAWGGDTSDKPVPGDYDGDGKADEAFYRASTGEWHILPSGGGTRYTVGWGTTGDKPVPGDYDGDGKTDLAIYRPSDGGWYISPSGGGEPYGVGWGGDASDKLVPGDYDGDRTIDIAIYRSSTGGWYILPSGGGDPYGLGWGGGPSDIPLNSNLPSY